ncbi:class I SAM-dependent methyltransferase [Nocardia sp. NBC_00565]|uniref:class I SAM-dependent methyltransferase n=1 Tax=Nocardia sp. NBC_00565 TaxID=2975993 RepID=UPI002E8171D1|nr:class I SAM-dependent methyltransferase [Nocardia sp. NBC_00565]WUC07743.1 class I SAM-dependent methyltransferase [Nocardia sp. NBC_00565]
MTDDYRVLNKAKWDERAPAHAASPDYAVTRFVSDPEFLSEVVRFDQPLLGDIRGLRGVHLQCHIGTDTISLARLGARMTGLDFSSAALTQARTLTEKTRTPVDFVESDVYDAVSALGAAQFDLVFTGIGALCWIPSIDHWAQTVAGLLRPGGRLFLREGHPMLAVSSDLQAVASGRAIDETRTDRPTVGYPYFEIPEPMVFSDGTTYVETDTEFTQLVTHEWNHGLGEVVTALLDHGMTITGLVEHRSVPWEALPGQMTREANGEWRLTEHPERLPLSYTLQARRQLAGGE